MFIEATEGWAEINNTCLELGHFHITLQMQNLSLPSANPTKKKRERLDASPCFQRPPSIASLLDQVRHHGECQLSTKRFACGFVLRWRTSEPFLIHHLHSVFLSWWDWSDFKNLFFVTFFIWISNLLKRDLSRRPVKRHKVTAQHVKYTCSKVLFKLNKSLNHNNPYFLLQFMLLMYILMLSY